MRRYVILGNLALGAASLSAQEQAIAIKDAPSAVIQRVSMRFPDAKIAGVSKETEEGRQVYEVSLKEKGRNIDVTTTSTGDLTLIEREISARDLPVAASKLLRAKYPGSTYKIVESVTAVSGGTEALSFYEILLVDSRKQRLEVQVAIDGSRVLKEEKKKPGEPND